MGDGVTRMYLFNLFFFSSSLFPFSSLFHLILQLGFLGLSYGVAMGLVNNPNALDLILSLLGATTSTIIAYIVPTVV